MNTSDIDTLSSRRQRRAEPHAEIAGAHVRVVERKIDGEIAAHFEVGVEFHGTGCRSRLFRHLPG